MAQMPRIGDVLHTTIVLAIASTALAVILGSGLAWGAAMLPARVRGVGQMIPLLPLLVPAASAVLGWMFMLSPSVGYINYLLRKLPFLDGLTTGPFDIYTVPWIILITGLLLASFVYLFIHTGLENMGEEMEAAAAAAVAGVCFRRRVPARNGAVHGSAAAWPQLGNRRADHADVLSRAGLSD
jgi:iron(III) transport system permease protein